MKKYQVTLISKDDHKYTCEVESETDDDAVKASLEKIWFKGWEMYEYKLQQLERIK